MKQINKIKNLNQKYNNHPNKLNKGNWLSYKPT